MNRLLEQDADGNWNFVKCTKEDLKFDLPDDAEILVVDWQLGHENVQLQTLRNLVDWCLEKPHRYCVLQDFTDDLWLSKFQHLTYGSDNETEELIRLTEQLDILEPIYSRFIFQIGSNHWARRFGLNLPAEKSQKARTQFNKIYGRIYRANPNFKQYESTECIITLKFKIHPTLEIPFIHPSKLGSTVTALNRVMKYFGFYGVSIGHIHSNIRKVIESAKGMKLYVWFSSHLFSEQPEYEKERMAIDEPSEPLILCWKQEALSKKWKFDKQ